MNMKRSRYSLNHFYYFLETLWEERLVKSATLNMWQEAIKEFQQVLTDEETLDLRSVEIKKLSRRYLDMLIDQRSSITPWRIHKLKSLMNTAVGEFIAFTINPLEYRCNKKLARAKEVFLSKHGAASDSRVVHLPGVQAKPNRSMNVIY